MIISLEESFDFNHKCTFKCSLVHVFNKSDPYHFLVPIVTYPCKTSLPFLTPNCKIKYFYPQHFSPQIIVFFLNI